VTDRSIAWEPQWNEEWRSCAFKKNLEPRIGDFYALNFLARLFGDGYVRDIMLKFRPENILEPARGRLLISEPFMDDPYFKRTVVLLCEHNEDGSFGFVLNRYIDVNITDLVEDMPQLGGRISVGGPVQNENLFYLHTLGEELEGSTEILDGIYMGGRFDVLKEKVQAGLVDEEKVRFFVGYSGWSSQQLEGELKEKAWLVLPARGKEVMDTKADDLWTRVLQERGNDQSYFANFPKDPNLN